MKRSRLKRSSPTYSAASDRVVDTILTVLALLIIAVCLYPFIYMLSLSVSDAVSVTKGEVHLLPKGLNFNAYKQLLKHPDLMRSFLNTLFYTIVGTAWSMFMTTLAAYALAKRDLPGKRFFNFFIVFTMIFSAGLIPTFLVVNKLGLYNTRAAIILVGAFSPWNLIVLRTYMQSLPVSLKESARIDGASEFYIFRKIYLPLSKPAVATIMLFYAVARWNDYFHALVYLIDTDKMPVQMIIRGLVITMNDALGSTIAVSGNANAYSPQSFRAAVIIVTMLPILCLYPFIQKYFTKGMMVGSVKG